LVFATQRGRPADGEAAQFHIKPLGGSDDVVDRVVGLEGDAFDYRRAGKWQARERDSDQAVRSEQSRDRPAVLAARLISGAAGRMPISPHFKSVSVPSARG